MVRAWPTCSRLGSSRGLAAIKASTFTPYFRAIALGVSPFLTMWVRWLAPGVTGDRLGFAAFDSAAPVAADAPDTDG